MSNKKKEALRVKTAKENIRLLKTESDSQSEAELEKTDYQDEPEAGESSNKEENGASSPKYGFPFKSNKENANEYDLIRFYLHEIADHALLSREEEIRIAKKLRREKGLLQRLFLVLL